MSLFGDIGNIFHSIGHFFNGGDNQQQQQPPQTWHAPMAAPIQQQPNNNGTQWHPPMVAPQQQQRPQQQAPQAPAPNGVNLFQGGPSAPHMPPLTSYDPNNFLNKAPATPQPHPSVMDDIKGAIHNAPGIAASIPLGVLRTGEGLVQGVTDIPKMALDLGTWGGDKLSGTNYKPQFVKNVDQWTNDVDAPQKWLQKKTDEAVGAYGGQPAQEAYHATQIAGNVATLIPAGAAMLAKAGQAGRVAGTLVDGANDVNKFMEAQKAASPTMQMLEKVKSGAVDWLKGDRGPATDIEVNKANTATDTNAAVTSPKPGEVAPGLTSVNPTQAEDAAAQVAQKEAQTTSDLVEPNNSSTPETNPQPAYQRGFGTETPTQVRDFQLRQRYGQLIKDHPDQAPQLRAHLQQLLDTPLPKETSGELSPAEAMPGPGAAPATAPAPKTDQPATHTQPSPETAPPVTPTPTHSVEPIDRTTEVPQSESPVPPAETPESLSSQSPITDNNVAQTPNNVNGRTAPNAPNIRAQAQTDLDAIGKEVDKDIDKTVPKGSAPEVGDAKVHEVLSNEQLNDAAQRYVQSMSDEELLAASRDGMTINGAGDIAKAYAVVKRLGKMAAEGNEEAKEAIPKILDAVEAHVSGAGRSLNFTGAMLDSLPKEAQENYIIKFINKVRDGNGLDPLDGDDEVAARDSIQKYLTAIESKKDAIAAAQGKLEQYRAGEAPDVNPAELQRQIEDTTREVHQLNTEVGKEAAKISGAKGDWGKTAGNTARGLMLTKVTGRISDIGTTSVNAADMLASHGVSGLLGKAYNKITGQPGRVIDTMPNAGQLVKGTFGKGMRDLKANYQDAWNGNARTPDLHTALTGGRASGKTNMLTSFVGTRAGRVIQQTGHAMAETATNLTEGLSSVHIQQMAEQQAKQAGLTGEDYTRYVKGIVADPPANMKAAGQQLVSEANNMNDNPIARMVSEIAKSPTMKKAAARLESSHAGKLAEFAGETVQNLVAPFTHWAATAAWNGATEKNAVANLIKAGAQISFKDGHFAIKDPQKFVDQLGGLVVHGGEAIGAGYVAAKTGILTTHNSEGYDDEGLYLHLGGHYIPVGDLGFMAPGIVMGWATHQAFTDPSNGSIVSKIGHATTNALTATLKGDLNNSIIGGNNEVIKQLQDWLRNRNGVQGGDVLATAGSDAAGNYIPGIAGDVNALMNHSSMNPTGDAATTKVTKGELGQTTKTGAPSTATDIIHTDINKFLNKIPVESQNLPRKPGVAANDIWSNIFRGDNGSKDQAEENSVIDGLPKDQQKDVRTNLTATNGEAQLHAQNAANAMPVGPNKDKAQQIADKMKFNAGSGVLDNAVQKAQQSADKTGFVKSNDDMQTINGKTYARIDGSVQTFANPQKAQQAIDQSQFAHSNKDIQTINGKTWANVNGTPKAFDTQTQAQQALDYEKFKTSGKAEDHVNGMVYQKGSNGKFSQMEQKDFDYKSANDQITSAKNSGDVSGYLKGHQDLLNNISWQLNHADLTDANRAQLTQKAVQLQEEYAKAVHDGGFSTPKGVPAYSTPTITGAKQYTPEEQKANGGYHDYTEVIQHMGAKYGLDINALLSVAAQEGLNGGVGDGGHAFGPFQMNDAGGVLTGKFSDPAKARAYAESPQGIEDAIKQIKAAVGNKTGEDAVRAIVTGFERPADPAKEIANALALYNGGKATLAPGGEGSTGVSSLTPSDASSESAQKAADLIKQNVVGQLLQPQRQSFINDFPTKPIALNLPQVKLTQPGQLIKAHKITVGMPKA